MCPAGHSQQRRQTKQTGNGFFPLSFQKSLPTHKFSPLFLPTKPHRETKSERGSVQVQAGKCACVLEAHAWTMRRVDHQRRSHITPSPPPAWLLGTHSGFRVAFSGHGMIRCWYLPGHAHAPCVCLCQSMCCAASPIICGPIKWSPAPTNPHDCSSYSPWPIETTASTGGCPSTCMRACVRLVRLATPALCPLGMLHLSSVAVCMWHVVVCMSKLVPALD